MNRTVISVFTIATVLTFAPSFIAASELHGGTQEGTAACYSNRLVGHRTTSGKRYNPKALTAAHAKIPLGTHVKITNIENGKSVVVLINDKMAKHARGIIVDVSKRACKELGFGHRGEAKVKIEVVNSAEASNAH
jgi:rare lipoprotein A